MSDTTPPASRWNFYSDPLVCHIEGHSYDNIETILESERWAACTFAESPGGPVLPLVAAIRCKAPLKIIELLLWHGATVTKEVLAAVASSGPYSLMGRMEAWATWSTVEQQISFMKERDARHELQQAYIKCFEAAVLDLRTYRCLSVVWARSTACISTPLFPASSTTVSNQNLSVEKNLNLLSVPIHIHGLLREYLGPCFFDRI